MSKSLGNFFTVRDLLDQGVPGEVIRFVMLSTHYRKPMDWTETKRLEAEKTLQAWYLTLHDAGFSSDMVNMLRDSDKWKPSPDVIDALSDDLNVHLAFTKLRKLNQVGSALQIADFAASLDFLGLVSNWDELGLLAGLGVESLNDAGHEDIVRKILLRRGEAKLSKDYALADEIRDVLVSAGVVIKDVPGGVSDFDISPSFDPTKLEGLV